jgi:hypothetical protein
MTSHTDVCLQNLILNVIQRYLGNRGSSVVVFINCARNQSKFSNTFRWHQTWSLALRENHRLGGTSGPKRDEIIGGWRTLHNDGLHVLYSSPNIIRIKARMTTWTGHVACMWEKRNVYRLLVGKAEGKRPLGRPRRRWEDNINMDLTEIECGNINWINLAQDGNHLLWTR